MRMRALLILILTTFLALMPAYPATFSQEHPPDETVVVAPVEAEVEAARADEYSPRAAALRAEIRTILNRPEFRFAGQGEARPLPLWMQWIKRTWNSMWRRLLEAGERVGEQSPWLVPVLLGIAAAVLLLLIWRVVSESFFQRRGLQEGLKDKGEPAPSMLFERASAAARKGDFTEAVRLLFQAAVLSLFGESARTTPAVMLRSRLLAIEGAPLSEFIELKRCFDSSFYGGAPVSRTDYENARASALALRRINEEELDEA